MSNYLWGIDLGGSKIEGVVLAPGAPLSPIARERINTEAEKGYDHILNRIQELVQSLTSKTGLTPKTIGFGTPGICDPETQLMKNCNSTCLNGMPLKDDLTKKLKLPIQLANDANCFALAESLLGAGKGATSLFGVIIGTGVGGGVVINGALHQGAHGIAGEWGHNFLIENGEVCYCGKKGCVETVISGPALEKYYERLSGRKKPLAEIALSAKEDDSAARDTIRFLQVNFARAISVVINILDPQIVVLGGGVSNIEAIYNEGLAELPQHIFNDKVSTRLVKNLLGDSGGVFGAAMLGAS